MITANPKPATDRLGHARSPHWRAAERVHLAAHPYCMYCGGSKALQVHHVMPFHLSPALELDPANLITLCEDRKDGVVCHLHIGHLGNWRAYNPAVRGVADARGPGLRASTYRT